MHQRLQRPRDVAIVDKDILRDVERDVAALQVTSLVIFHSLAKNEILRASRRPNRIGLHKAHAVQRPWQRRWAKEVAGNGNPAQLIDCDRS
jgi:hypothetical protein